MAGTLAGAAKRRYANDDLDPPQAVWDAMTAEQRATLLAELDAEVEQRRASMPPWLPNELAWENDGQGVATRMTDERFRQRRVGRAALITVITRTQGHGRVNRRRLAKGDG
jgi:hypothetical protein